LFSDRNEILNPIEKSLVIILVKKYSVRVLNSRLSFDFVFFLFYFIFYFSFTLF